MISIINLTTQKILAFKLRRLRRKLGVYSMMTWDKQGHVRHIKPSTPTPIEGYLARLQVAEASVASHQPGAERNFWEVCEDAAGLFIHQQQIPAAREGLAEIVGFVCANFPEDSYANDFLADLRRTLLVKKVQLPELPDRAPVVEEPSAVLVH